jgi:hypothetical protein
MEEKEKFNAELLMTAELEKKSPVRATNYTVIKSINLKKFTLKVVSTLFK